MTSKRELKAAYKREVQPMGVFVLLNRATRTAYIASSANLTGAKNALDFTLKTGSHINRALVADWKAHGAAAFAFEIVDRLESKAGETDYRAELKTLLKMRLEAGLADGTGAPLTLVPLH